MGFKPRHLATVLINVIIKSRILVWVHKPASLHGIGAEGAEGGYGGFRQRGRPFDVGGGRRGRALASMGATMDPVPSCWGHSEKSDQRTGLMQVPTVRSERTPGHAGVRQGLSARRRSSLPEQDASLETIDVSGERGQKRRVHQKPMRRRRLALALPLLLAAATPVLGFGAGAHGPAPAMHSGGETSRSALSKVVQSLEQTQDANKNLLAQLRAEMGEWASKLDALRCRVVPGHPDGGKSADCSTASSNGDTMSEVSLDEAGTAAVKAKKHSEAAFADAEDLESAVTSAAGDGSLGNLENEVHSGTTRNVKKSRESVVQRTEMAEMPLSGDCPLRIAR